MGGAASGSEQLQDAVVGPDVSVELVGHELRAELRLHADAEAIAALRVKLRAPQTMTWAELTSLDEELADEPTCENCGEVESDCECE
jgi:hypothetical protein